MECGGGIIRVAIRVIFSPVRFGQTGLGVWFGPVRWYGLLVRVVGSTRVDYVDVVPLVHTTYLCAMDLSVKSI